MSEKTGVTNVQDFGQQMAYYLSRLKSALDLLQPAQVNTVINVMRSTYRENRTIFLMGNGGSAATASHIVCDLTKSLCEGSGPRVKALSLNDNVPSMLAIANDISYESIFVEQLRNHLQPNDIVMAISGSGNSANIIKALEYANQSNGVTIGLCGYDGGLLKKLARYFIHVPIDDMLIVEDVHSILGHMCCRLLKEALKEEY